MSIEPILHDLRISFQKGNTFQACSSYHLEKSEEWPTLAAALAKHSYYLAAAVADDTTGGDQALQSGPYKWTHLLGRRGQKKYISLSYCLRHDSTIYPSACDSFTALAAYEREAYDLLGLVPHKEIIPNQTGARLHANFPSKLYPLRRDRSLDELRFLVREQVAGGPYYVPLPTDVESGLVLKYVGPRHASVGMPPGLFIFWLHGDRIEKMRIRLGFTHRGIERLFQEYSPKESYRLAARIAADSTVAHTLAHCRAIEGLANVEVSLGAKWLRVLFLEIERIAYHIGNLASLSQIGGPRIVASQLGILREQVLRLNKRYFGSRLLRGDLILPGGVGIALPSKSALNLLLQELDETVSRCLTLCIALTRPAGPTWLRNLIGWPFFYDRARNLGTLTTEDAVRYGAKGLLARASGVADDCRLHQMGVYSESEVQAILASEKWRQVVPGLDGADDLAIKGDVFARFLQRVRDIWVSRELIRVVASRWQDKWVSQTNWTPIAFDKLPPRVPWYGEAEGWRGSVIHYLEMGDDQRLRRVKVVDSSLHNWQALEFIFSSGHMKLSNFPFTANSVNPSYPANDL